MTHITTVTRLATGANLSLKEWCASKPNSLLSSYPECAGKSCLDVFTEAMDHMENSEGFINLTITTSADGRSMTTEVVWATPEDEYAYLLSAHKKFTGPGEYFLDKNSKPIKDYYGNYLYKSPFGFLHDEWLKECIVSNDYSLQPPLDF